MIHTSDGRYMFNFIDCCTYDLCDPPDEPHDSKVLFAVHKPAPNHPQGVWILAATLTADRLAEALLEMTQPAIFEIDVDQFRGMAEDASHPTCTCGIAIAEAGSLCTDLDCFYR